MLIKHYTLDMTTNRLSVYHKLSSDTAATLFNFYYTTNNPRELLEAVITLFRINNIFLTALEIKNLRSFIKSYVK